MPVNEKIRRAFTKVAGTAIATVGEAAQKDLIFLGITLGYTEQEIQSEFPNLFESVDTNELDIYEHYPESENLEEQENEEREERENEN